MIGWLGGDIEGGRRVEACGNTLGGGTRLGTIGDRPSRITILDWLGLVVLPREALEPGESMSVDLGDCAGLRFFFFSPISLLRQL